MDNFEGTVQMVMGEFRTFQELVHRVLNARTYSADPDEQAELKARYVSAFQAVAGTINRIMPSADVYIMDAYKGNTNGIIDQSAWAAVDFTTGPAGALYQGGVERQFLSRISLASLVVYAPAACNIELDIAIGSEW